MSFSHKKMKEIKNKIDEVIIEDNTIEEQKEKLYEFLKEILKYNEKYGGYNKERYESYTKQYIENNREKINVQKAESARRRYHQKKLEKKLDNKLEIT